MKPFFTILGLCLFAASSGCALSRSCHEPLHCSSCGKTCHAEVKETESTHTCFSDECKDICIPALRFPWEDCCAPLKCGRVRSVKVLTKYEYKCPDCEVEWSVVDNGCGPNGCGPNRCYSGSDGTWCGDDTGSYPAPQPLPRTENATGKPALPPPPMPLQPVNYFAPAL